MRVRRFAVLLLFSYFLPWSYCLLSQFWAPHGGASTKLNFFEFPLLLVFSLGLYCRPQKKEKRCSIHEAAPALLFLGLYLLYDVAYSFFHRSPRPTDLKNIPLLLEAGPTLFFAGTAVVAAAAVPTIFSIVLWMRGTPVREILSQIAVRAMMFLVLFLFLFSEPVFTFQTEKLHYQSFSDTLNIKRNGRLTSFIYYHNKRKSHLKNITAADHINIAKFFYAGHPPELRNIHIVVLESFLDPRLLKDVHFSMDPVFGPLNAFLLNQSFSIVHSPVYGGGTAQSEFELLTGLPAFALFDSIEFNVFEGTGTSSFVRRMNQLGYRSFATMATSVDFYNAEAAYNGIGFQKTRFLGEKKLGRKKNKDRELFDGDLFEDNLRRLQGYRRESIPVLNYLVGMYGHFPYHRNTQVRPDMVDTDSKNPVVHRIANQFYHRTRALYHFLAALEKKDPDAIILVVSDHLPPIFNSRTQYSLSLNANIALLLDRFRPVDISGRRLFELPHLLWSLLVRKPPPSSPDSIFHPFPAEKVYQSLMLEAMALAEPYRQQ